MRGCSSEGPTARRKETATSPPSFLFWEHSLFGNLMDSFGIKRSKSATKYDGRSRLILQRCFRQVFDNHDTPSTHARTRTRVPERHERLSNPRLSPMTSNHLPGLALLPGNVVRGRFKILREIGNGTTASVLLARDVDSKQRVAIKTALLSKQVRALAGGGGGVVFSPVFWCLFPGRAYTAGWLPPSTGCTSCCSQLL
jgi:hypothetical protein